MIDVPEKVKELFQKDGVVPKEVVISFPNGEREDITTKDLASDSVSFDESLCSQEYLKFGLTEASMLQFETMGVENIIGREIECAYDVYSHTMVGKDIYFSGNTGSEITERDTMWDNDNFYEDDTGATLMIREGMKWCYIYFAGERSASEDIPGYDNRLAKGDVCKYDRATNSFVKIVPSEELARKIKGVAFGGDDVYMPNSSTGEGETQYFKVGKWFNPLIGEDEVDIFVYGGTPTFVTFEDVYTKEGSVPLGRFTVQSCPRNHESMTHRQVIAYSSNKIELSDFTKWFLGLRQTQNEIKFDVQNMLAVNVNMDGFSDMYTAQSIGNATSHRPSMFGTKGNDSYYMGGVEVRGTGGTYGYESINAAEMNLNDGNLYKIRLTKGADYDSFVSMLDSLRNDGVVFGNEHTYRPYMQGVISHYDNGYNDFWLDFGKDYYIYVPNDSNFTVELEAFYKGDYNVKVFYGNGAYSWYSPYVFTLIGEYEIISDVQITRYDSSMPAIECVMKSTGSYVDSNVTYQTFTDAVDFTKLFNGWLELNALFGKQQRDGSYALKHLSKDKPIEISKDLIRRLWWDEYDVEPIGSVKYKFKSGDTENITVYNFGNGKSTYDMTNNYVLQNMDAANATNINLLLDSLFIPNIGDIAFTPVEMSMKGLPYLEDGDFLRIVVKDDTEVMESSLIYNNILGYVAEFELPSTELRVYESKIQQVKVEGVIVTDYSVYAEQYAEDSFTLIIGLTGYTSGTVTLLYGEREVVETYIMNHTISGIQALNDDIESNGGEIIESEVE